MEAILAQQPALAALLDPRMLHSHDATQPRHQRVQPARTTAAKWKLRGPWSGHAWPLMREIVARDHNLPAQVNDLRRLQHRLQSRRRSLVRRAMRDRYEIRTVRARERRCEAHVVAGPNRSDLYESTGCDRTVSG